MEPRAASPHDPTRRRFLVAAVAVALLLAAVVAVAATVGGDGGPDRSEQDPPTGSSTDRDEERPMDDGPRDGGRDEDKAVEQTGAPDPDDPQTYGEDGTLDALWDRCDAGAFAACDDLYLASGFGTGYEKFGATCGGRNESAGYCTSIYADGAADGAEEGGDDPVAAIDTTSEAYGDDDDLDGLWDDCEDGDLAACDDLYLNSPFGSAYEEFGATCGHRTEARGSCEELSG